MLLHLSPTPTKSSDLPTIDIGDITVQSVETELSLTNSQTKQENRLVVDNSKSTSQTVVPFLGLVHQSNKDPPPLPKQTTQLIDKHEKKKKFWRGKRGGTNNKKRQKISSTDVKPVQIFNLSNYNLNLHEIKLLEKGFSFCTTYNVDQFQLFLDLQKCIRNITPKGYFYIQEQKKLVSNNNTQDQTAEKERPTLRVGKGKEVKGLFTFYPIYCQGNFMETFHELALRKSNHRHWEGRLQFRKS